MKREYRITITGDDGPVDIRVILGPGMKGSLKPIHRQKLTLASFVCDLLAALFSLVLMLMSNTWWGVGISVASMLLWGIMAGHDFHKWREGE